MQTYQHIHVCLQRYIKGSFVGKFRISVVLGLLLFVATFIVNVPGASAHALTPCSGSDHTYSVVGGDTLSRIGYRYGTSWSVLASYNHLVNPNSISIGQIVCIPAYGATSHMPMQGQVQQKSVTTSSGPQTGSNGSIQSMINQTFGPYGSAAITVARCESGLNPGAYNPSGAAGLFQIMPGTWAGTSEVGQSPYNASANIAAAHQIFVRDGYSWREWTCQP